MQFRRPSAPQAVIDIAPLVDVVFLLVIFFAVSTTFLDTAGLKLDLPSSTSTAEHEPRELTVLLAADGTLSFDGNILEKEALGNELREALDAQEVKMVELKADREARHGDVIGVMDVIRNAGALEMRLGAQAAQALASAP
jgi:biopolymer transport protein ExbD